MTLTLLIVSILLAVLFVGTVVWRRWRDADASASFSGLLNAALPDSVSAMVYELPRRRQWLWIVWMWAVSLLTCIPLTDALPSCCRFLGFLTLASLFFCGAMPLVKDERNVAHYVFGASAGVLSQVCVAFIDLRWLCLWVIFSATILFKGVYYTGSYFNGKGLFLVEMICAATVCGSLLVRLASAS